MPYIQCSSSDSGYFQAVCKIVEYMVALVLVGVRAISVAGVFLWKRYMTLDVDKGCDSKVACNVAQHSCMHVPARMGLLFNVGFQCMTMMVLLG